MLDGSFRLGCRPFFAACSGDKHWVLVLSWLSMLEELLAFSAVPTRSMIRLSAGLMRSLYLLASVPQLPAVTCACRDAEPASTPIRWQRDQDCATA